MKKYSEKKSEGTITTSNMARLTSIFSSHGWKIGGDIITGNIFDDFCEMLNKYNDKQQKLILNLAEDFLWINVNDYLHHIFEVFNKVANSSSENIINAKTLFLVPLVSEEDIGKSKSAHSLLYIMKGIVTHLERLFSDKRIIWADSYDVIIERRNQLGNSAIILIDDYVGTGDTAISAVDYLLKNHIEIKQLSIATLVIQETGVKNISGKGLEIYFSIIRDKGITNHYTEEVAKDMFEIMDSIEEKIKIDLKYKYGYGQTEALISMMRTPNNTFPVFWRESKKVPNVPFARRG